MAFDAARLPALLDALPLHPDKGEYYLTDTVALAVGARLGLRRDRRARPRRAWVSTPRRSWPQAPRWCSAGCGCGCSRRA